MSIKDTEKLTWGIAAMEQECADGRKAQAIGLRDWRTPLEFVLQFTRLQLRRLRESEGR
jgi:hypothetical protein